MTRFTPAKSWNALEALGASRRQNEHLLCKLAFGGRPKRTEPWRKRRKRSTGRGFVGSFWIFAPQPAVVEDQKPFVWTKAGLLTNSSHMSCCPTISFRRCFATADWWRRARHIERDRINRLYTVDQRLEAIATRVEAIATTGRPSLLGSFCY